MRAFLALLLAAVSAKNSSGCGKDVSIKKGELVTVNLGDVQGENGLTVSREYAIYVPTGYDPSKSYALGFWFHGWTINFLEEANNLPDFQTLSESTNEFLMVYPRGMGDYGGEKYKKGWASWNYGCTGPTCKSCRKWVQGYCYDSCNSLDLCGSCNWATCYDDVAFVRELVKSLEDTYCVDTKKIYISGESNGGMIMHYLTSMMSDVWAATMPVFGLPQKDHWWMPEGDNRIAYLQLHGTNDKTVPWDGSFSEDGYKYLSGETVLTEWATHHDCEKNPTKFSPDVEFRPMDGVECYKYKNCKSGKLVGYCLFDGGHMWPDKTEELVWWFWKHHNDVSGDTTNSLSSESKVVE